MRITYYVAMSIDGYIARPDGDVSWLDELDIAPEQTGYEEFFATVDGLIMGRATWEQIDGFGAWPYGELPVWVVSSREVVAIEGVQAEPQLGLEGSVAAAAAKGLEHLWVVGGGQLAGGLLNAGLLTHVSICPMPTVLGEGISLFSGLVDRSRLRLATCTTRPNGVVMLDYEVARSE